MKYSLEYKVYLLIIDGNNCCLRINMKTDVMFAIFSIEITRLFDHGEKKTSETSYNGTM